MIDKCQFCEKETYVSDENKEPVICEECYTKFYAPMQEDMDEVEKTFLNLTETRRYVDR